MRVSGVLNAAQLVAETPDLIVFPEGVQFSELQQARSKHPRAIVIGAVLERWCCRAYLLHQGDDNQIVYLKVGPYMHTPGSGDVNQQPVYECGDVCIGVLICMDVNCPALAQSVTERIKSANAIHKFLCIPADMSADWFKDKNLFGSIFDGMHVLMCNNTATYGLDGCQSFITDTHGKKISVWTPGEPFHAELSR